MSSANHKSVLIVDDEAPMARALQAILRREGYSALTATNGDDALVLCSGEKLDLVISDVRMPGMSGFRLAAQIGHLPDPPAVLLMSGDSEPAAIDRDSASAYAGEILMKPFAWDELLGAVSRALANLPVN